MIDLFTKQERLLILFLLFGILFGAGLKILKVNVHSKEQPPITKYRLLEEKIVNKANEIDSLMGSNQALTQQQININNATVNELVKLPQVGPVLAKRIFEYRKESGEFKNISELTKVRGIGKKKLEKIKPFIIVKKEN